MSPKVILLMFISLHARNILVRAEARIVGGYLCKVQDYPFVVEIYGAVGCGGSLITLQWVLTAGHCINQLSIEKGTTIIRAGYNAPSYYIQRRKAKQAVVHKKFKLEAITTTDRPPELRYDIALILIQGSFRTSKVLRPIGLPRPGFTKGCEMGKAIGTGFTEIRRVKRSVGNGSDGNLKPKVIRESGFLNRPLKCVDLHITGNENCARTFSGSVIDDSIVCTMEYTEGQDACQGDSGGPLVCFKGKTPTIIGIVSAGVGCGVANNSATYTRVESYLSFINATTFRSGGNLFKRVNVEIVGLALLFLLILHQILLCGVFL